MKRLISWVVVGTCAGAAAFACSSSSSSDATDAGAPDATEAPDTSTPASVDSGGAADATVADAGIDAGDDAGIVDAGVDAFDGADPYGPKDVQLRLLISTIGEDRKLCLASDTNAARPVFELFTDGFGFAELSGSVALEADLYKVAEITATDPCPASATGLPHLITLTSGGSYLWVAGTALTMNPAKAERFVSAATFLNGSVDVGTTQLGSFIAQFSLVNTIGTNIQSSNVAFGLGNPEVVRTSSTMTVVKQLSLTADYIGKDSYIMALLGDGTVAPYTLLLCDDVAPLTGGKAKCTKSP